METNVKLKIGGAIIQIKSDFPLEHLTRERRRLALTERFNSFFYHGNRPHQIAVDVELTDALPKMPPDKHIFTTYHFQDGSENWRLEMKGCDYIYKTSIDDKQQLMVVSGNFSKVKAYLLFKKSKIEFKPRLSGGREKHTGVFNDGRFRGCNKLSWNVTDIIYDFLQVLLINYFALNKQGIFVHSVGIKDTNGNGLIFAGESGSGKSTTARLWHGNTRARVLNDDRVIVRKSGSSFFAYGSPWHGEFSDYLVSRMDSAPLKKLFFIYHSSRNTVKRISGKESFRLLYPALFPTFWDKGCLTNIASFCQDLINSVPCYSLGFVNDKKVIQFVRDVR